VTSSRLVSFPTKCGHARTGSAATLRLPAVRSNYTDHDLLQQLSLTGRHTYCGHSGSPVQMCVTKKSDYKVNVWGRDHATCSLNGPKCPIIVNWQAVEMIGQNVCLILKISWNVRNDTPISTFCSPLSTHCLFVQGDMAVKQLVWQTRTNSIIDLWTHFAAFIVLQFPKLFVC